MIGDDEDRREGVDEVVVAVVVKVVVVAGMSW